MINEFCIQIYLPIEKFDVMHARESRLLKPRPDTLGLDTIVVKKSEILHPATFPTTSLFAGGSMSALRLRAQPDKSRRIVDATP